PPVNSPPILSNGPRNKPSPTQPTKLLSCTVARSRKDREKNICLFTAGAGILGMAYGGSTVLTVGGAQSLPTRPRGWLETGHRGPHKVRLGKLPLADQRLR